MSAAASGAFVAGGACKSLGQLLDHTALNELQDSHALTYRDSWDGHEGADPNAVNHQVPIEVPESQPIEQLEDRQRHPDSATPTPYKKLDGVPGLQVAAAALEEKPLDVASVGTVEEQPTPVEVETSDFGDVPQQERPNVPGKMVYDKHYHSFLGEM